MAGEGRGVGPGAGRIALTLADDRIARFSRQLLLPGFGEAAQERLAAARVRAVGAGGAVSAALAYLVQAGVGRLWIDDAEPVAPADATGWIYGQADVGTPRVDAARDALRALSRFCDVEAYPAGGVPTATLVAAPSLAQALHAAEAARRAGVPHVVLEPDADGGAIVTVPPGAPCYACARSTTGAGRPPLPGAAALAALAASELVHLVATPDAVPGRRVDLVRGVATVRPTSRLAGCACGAAPGAQSPATGPASGSAN
ncbi:MAG TPA: ThiF family adenylyltransferase [Anaeromyxobacter sp.]|nr:ThiF family adenylyltransferase [Anaeromyxobacter sp.]